VTEIFFLTQRALHVGVVPAMNAYSSIVSDLAKEVQSGNADERIKVLMTVRLVMVVVRIDLRYFNVWPHLSIDLKFLKTHNR